MAKDYWVDSNEIDLAHHAFLIIWSIVLLRVVDLNYIVIRLFYCDDSIICNSLFGLCSTPFLMLDTTSSCGFVTVLN